jgi:hypothetical protein
MVVVVVGATVVDVVVLLAVETTGANVVDVLSLVSTLVPVPDDAHPASTRNVIESAATHARRFMVLPMCLPPPAGRQRYRAPGVNRGTTTALGVPDAQAP